MAKGLKSTPRPIYCLKKMKDWGSDMSMLDTSHYVIRKKCKKCKVVFDTKSRTRVSCEVCSPPVKRF